MGESVEPPSTFPDPRRMTAPFVGRQAHLAWLDRCLQEALIGTPRVALLPGEAGLGKTRLLKEVHDRLARQWGFQVFTGHCYEELTLPYHPFVEALRPQWSRLVTALESVLGAGVELLNRLFYPDQYAYATADPLLTGQDEPGKLRLFLALSRALIVLAQECPTCFLVEDLHWADQASLDFFGYLVFTMTDAAIRESVPLLIIGTYRPVGPAEPLARLVARVQREESCQTLAMTSLSEAESYELLQGLGVVRPSHQLLTTFLETTRGSPLFIEALLRHFIQHQALQQRDGYMVSTTTPADVRLHEDVTGMFRARTQGLTTHCRSALTLAAVLGENFALPVLRAASGEEEETLLTWLEEGLQQGLLQNVGQTFQFAHPLIRHVFYHTPSTIRRQRLHRQVARALEQFYGNQRDAHSLEIAHHLLRAGPAAEADTMLWYMRRAGDQACAMFAWREAATYYTAGLSVAGSAGQLTAHEETELHYLAGLAYLRDGDVLPCRTHYTRAIEGYRGLQDLAGLARALMLQTFASPNTASYGSLPDLYPLEEVLEALHESEPRLRGSILTSMSDAYWTARQPRKAEEMARRALEIGQEFHDEQLCTVASFQLALAANQQLNVEIALQHYHHTRMYARRCGDLWYESWPLQRIPIALVLSGRFAEAQTVATEAYELAVKTNNWGHHSLVSGALACVAVARGDFDRAERHTQDTMALLARSRYPYGGALALPAVACARALRGAWQSAEKALDTLLEPGAVFEQPGSVFTAMTQVYRQLVRLWAGAAGVPQAPPTPTVQALVGKEGVDVTALAPLCALIEIADHLGTPALVKQPYQALSLAVAQGVLFTRGWMFLIPRVLGVAAALCQQWETAEDYFRQALEVAGRVQARPELGRTYLDYARMLSRREEYANLARAVECAQQAAVLFGELGMSPFSQRAAQLTLALQQHMASSLPRPTQEFRSTSATSIYLRLAQSDMHFLV